MDSNSIPSAGKTFQAGNGLSSGQAVKILGLPESLTNLNRATRVEGQVTNVQRDGVVRILTPEGDVDVQVRGKNQPQTGQRVEIEIPAGRPPRQASLRQDISREAPQNNNNATNQPAPTRPTQTVPPQNQTQDQVRVQTQPVTQAPQTSQPVTTTRPYTAPLPSLTTTQPTAQPATQAQAPVQPLPLNTPVRLLSIPPAQAIDIASQSFANLTTTIATIPRAAFTANLITENISTNLSQSLINAVKTTPALTLSTPTTVPQIPQTAQILSTPLTNLTGQITTPQNQTQISNVIQTTNIGNVVTPTNIVTQNTIPNTIPNPLNILPQAITANNAFLPPVNNTVPTQAINLNLINPVNGSGTTSFLQTPIIQASTQPITVPITPQTTPIPTPATITPIAINNITTENNFVLSNTATQKIDVQILKITPPEILLTPPTNIGGNNKTPNIIPANTTFQPAIISNNQASTITANVTGLTPTGLPLITLQLPGTTLPQSFILQSSAPNIKIGAQLQLSGLITPKGSAVNAPVQSALPPLFQSTQWAVIEELYQSLLHTNPQAAQSFARTLPNAINPSQMGPTAMMFIAAIRAGDIGGWLGDKKMDLLQRMDRSNIISRLTQETGATMRTAIPESAASEWRAVPLPMFWESEIQKIMLYTKHSNEHNQQENENGDQTRFIFDLNLSRMGDVQLDGLLKEKRLDLVVRTQNMMSGPMQETMRKAYLTALSHTSMNGELYFQGSTKDWVNVLQSKEQLGVNA